MDDGRSHMEMEQAPPCPGVSPVRIVLQLAGQLVTRLLIQFRRLGKGLVLLYLVVFLGLLALVVISQGLGVPVQNLTRDPVAVIRAPFYTGILSNLGILLWCASAAISLFCAALVGRLGRDRKQQSFLFWSGAFIILLLLDDLFLLHEVVFPYYFGLRERYVILLYGFCMVAYLVRFWRTMLNTDFLIFFCAGGLFTLSLAVDKLPEDILPLHHIFEDGSKFLGIASWLLYLVRTSFQLVIDAVPGRAVKEGM